MPATTWGAPWLFLKSSDPPKLSKPARHSRPGRRFHPQRRLTAPPLLPLHPPPPVRLFAGLQFFLETVTPRGQKKARKHGKKGLLDESAPGKWIRKAISALNKRQPLWRFLVQ
jgi:hypothetical protein